MGDDNKEALIQSERERCNNLIEIQELKKQLSKIDWLYAKLGICPECRMDARNDIDINFCPQCGHQAPCNFKRLPTI